MKSNLIKVLLAGAMLVFGSLVAGAQPQGGRTMDPAQFAKMRADQMKETVQLNDDQYKKVVDVFTEQMAEMQKSMSQGQGGQPGFNREAMQKMREQNEAKLKAILTEDQYKKWSESESNRRPGQGGPQGRAPRN